MASFNHDETAEGSGESQSKSILKKNKVDYLIPMLQKNNIDLDELIEFDSNLLDETMKFINFRSPFDKIRFKKSINDYKEFKLNNSLISPSQSLSSLQSNNSSSLIPIVITLDDETQTFRNKLNNHIEESENCMKNLQKSINNLNNLKKIKKEFINNKCDEMIKEIEKFKNQILLPKINKIFLNKVNIFRNQLTQLTIYNKQLCDTKQNVKNILINSSLNNKQRKQQIINPIKKTINNKISLYPVISSFIDIKFNQSLFNQQLSTYWETISNGVPYHQPIEWLTMQCGSGTNDILVSFKIPSFNNYLLKTINGFKIYYREIDNDDNDQKYDDYNDINNNLFEYEDLKQIESPLSYNLTDLMESTTYRILACSYNNKYGNSCLSKALTMKTNDILQIDRINKKQIKHHLQPIDKVKLLFCKMRLNRDFSDKLFEIFIRVDRELFVPSDKQSICNEKDTPIDINYGVSLSAPHIHIHALEQFEYLFSEPYINEKGVKFLDVGCGSGYVCSLMSVGFLLYMNSKKMNISFESFGCGYHPKLIEQANNACNVMKLNDILSFKQSTTNINDIGWRENGLYDGIYCGAAITKNDSILLRKQLQIGGILMCVVEINNSSQEMKLIKKIDEMNYQETKLFGCRFRTLRGRFKFL